MIFTPFNANNFRLGWDGDTGVNAEFLKIVGYVGFSDKKLFGPTGGYSTFHCVVR